MINHINKADPGEINSGSINRESLNKQQSSFDDTHPTEPISVTDDISESEEMYLIAIARLAEQGVQEPIPISLLAKELSIQPVSANQMVHKLADAGLLDYLPYKGVRLTASGWKVARHVLRHRRLWEVFLVEHLEIALDEADALACRLGTHHSHQRRR